ncbi:MAG: trigger factor [Gammaproteobacteria bacterium]|nr:trigger factor [Gammaproteobacteria bacterium]
MQVSVESTGPLERRLKVEVPEEKIATEVQSRLQSMTKTTRIKGFRQGKVPLKIVEKQYGTKVRQEVIGEVMQNSLYEAITQEKLRPATRPELENFDADQKEGLVFTAKIEVLPEINLSPVEELIIEKSVCKVSEDDIDKMIEVLRKQHRKPEAVEREAVDSDSVVIDFIGRIDGEEFQGGSAKDIDLELGAKKFIEGFEEGLLGARAGDNRILKLKFPDEYANQELAGKDVEFEVDVKTVNELVSPEMDSEFFSIMGVTDGGLEEFRTEVRKNMVRESEQKSLTKVKETVMEALYKSNKIDLPSTLVANEIAQLQAQFKSRLQQQGLSESDIPEGDASMFNEQAEKRVTLQLLIADILKENEIKVDQSKVRSKIEKAAEGYEDTSEVINWYYSDKNRLAEVEALVLEEQVINWIMDKAKVNETELAFDALMN